MEDKTKIAQNDLVELSALIQKIKTVELDMASIKEQCERSKDQLKNYKGREAVLPCNLNLDLYLVNSSEIDALCLAIMSRLEKEKAQLTMDIKAKAAKI
jgi:uncharacterized protein (UPF0335 family)